MKKQFVAYEGQKFTIEWYFNDNGKSLGLKCFNELPEEQKDRMLYLFQILGDIGKIFNKEKFRLEQNQIYALKASQDRFLCFFFEKSKIIITNGFQKKRAKMSLRELEKAIKAREDFNTRYNQGNYYD